MRKGFINSVLTAVFVLIYLSVELEPLLQKYLSEKACLVDVVTQIKKQKRIQQLLNDLEISEDQLIEFQIELCSK